MKAWACVALLIVAVAVLRVWDFVTGQPSSWPEEGPS